MSTQTPQPAVADLAAATKSDRNRAVDAYRVLAMVAVAIGHWAAIAVSTDTNGDIVAGNAL
ncbi:MAG: acyltransferase family protein, partial [Acidimicrobiales bacterium]